MAGNFRAKALIDGVQSRFWHIIYLTANHIAAFAVS